MKTVSRRRLIRGAASGMAATVPMTAVMLLAYRLLPAEQRYGLEPELVVEQMLRRLGWLDRMSRKEVGALVTAAHFGFGATAGATVEASMGRLVRRSPIVRGAASGVAVWALSYMGWLPALGILPPENRRPGGRTVENIAAHVVWGASLASVSRRMESGFDSPPRAVAGHERHWRSPQSQPSASPGEDGA